MTRGRRELRGLTALAALATGLVSARPADALPRFAARNAMECIQCHVNPTGGGMRNEYGRSVFEHTLLTLATRPDPASWLAPASLAAPAPEASSTESAASPAPGEDPAATTPVPFTGSINEWLALGADLRAGFIWIRPDRGAIAGQPREVTGSFFLMQADLYHSAQLGPHVTLNLDVGVYSGFEAWGLLRLFRDPDPGDLDVFLKAGRFLPPFGIREVEHQLFTREGVGLGAQDRDTGLELTGYWGPATLNVALLNGNLGDSSFDTSGTEHRSFEKALAARLSARANLGWARGQLGLSLYWNENVSQANPLFSGRLPVATAGEASQGLDELRKGAFVTLNVGRFTYMADLVLVDDDFYSDALASIGGYASYQELSFVAMQGLELVGTFEFSEPDLEILDNSKSRLGLVAEFFPFPYTEVRAMFRKTWSDDSPTGGSYDFVMFLHLFL